MFHRSRIYAIENLARALNDRNEPCLSNKLTCTGSPPGLHREDNTFPTLPTTSNSDYALKQQYSAAWRDDKRDANCVVSGISQNMLEGVSPSIQQLIRKAADKYPLDMKFWRKYKSVPAMANVRDKTSILEILENFAKIHRKHIYLFQRLKHTIVMDMDSWTAPELAKVCTSWAQLGFLTDRFTEEMSDRVVKTINLCDAEALARLLDAYASTRTRHLEAPLKALAETSLMKIDDFTPQQLCLHCSSFARLNLVYEPIFEAIADRLSRAGEDALKALTLAPEDSDPLAVLSMANPSSVYSARDVALAAYSFGKLEGIDSTQQHIVLPAPPPPPPSAAAAAGRHHGDTSARAFDALSVLATLVLRDCTARELQMLATGFDRHRHHTPLEERKPFDSHLLRAMGAQAKRRIAQFSAESLVLFLRSFSNLCATSPDRDELMDLLLSRVSSHLPRAVSTFKSIDLVTTLQVYAKRGAKHSDVADLLANSVLEKRAELTPSDWVSVIDSIAAMRGPLRLVMRAARESSGGSLIGKLKTQQLASIVTACCENEYYQADDLLPLIIELKSRTLHIPHALDADTAAQVFIVLCNMEVPQLLTVNGGKLEGSSKLLSLENSLGLLDWLMPRLTSPGGGRPSPMVAGKVLECLAEMDDAEFRQAAGGSNEVTCLAGEMLTAVREESADTAEGGAKRSTNTDYFTTGSVGSSFAEDPAVDSDPEEHDGEGEVRRQRAEELYMRIVHGGEHPARKYTATIPDEVLMRDLSERPSPFWI